MAGQVADPEVLLVDRPDRIGSASDRLRESGLSVRAEADAEAALGQAESVDCVVASYDLQDTDGIALFRSVRARVPDLPYVLFPAEGSEAIAATAVGIGITDYVPRDEDCLSGLDPYECLRDRVGAVVARRRARRDDQIAASRFVALAQNMSDAVVVVDTDSTIQYVNPAIERLLGYDPDRIRGESLTALMPERFQQRHLEAVESYLLDGERSIDWTGVTFPARHRDGHEVPLEISFSEFTHDDKRFFAGVLRPVD